MTGMSITFAVAASRSFIKKRGMASIVAVLGFIVLINAASKLGDVLNAALGWHTDPLFINDTMVSIPIPSFIVFALFAAVLFAASSWLIEKKVEV
jgi:hypothetical protein